MAIPEVWVVTDGFYSDYRIIAIFLTEAEAQDFAGGMGGGDIEKFPIGAPGEDKFRRTWKVHLDLETGDLCKGPCWGLTAEREGFEQHPVDWSATYVYKPGGSSYPAFVSGASVVSRDHALKIAAEARQAYLRETQAGVLDLKGGGKG